MDSHIARQTLKVSIPAAVAVLIARQLVRRGRYFDLNGKVVLITGGSRGLGLALAREFSGRGARVAVCARDEGELSRARAEFERMGGDFVAHRCDVGVREEIERIIGLVEDEFGAIDVLVNNAGAMLVGPLENLDVPAFEDVMRTNFWGAAYAVQAVSEPMKRRRRGRIVNIASVGGKCAFPHLLPYTASKFALVGYSQGLRAELAKHGILVTTVCPGLIRTGSPRNADFTGQHQREYEWFAISDSLPGASINAERAARRIVNACVHGESEVHLGWSAKLASIAQGLIPGLATELMAVVDHLLPNPGQPGSARHKGFESETPLTTSRLTRLTRIAEARQNQR
jgi:NAD(P)-dependent dehydrogenase (short-subunit alcohol dehydrogenase family)